MEILFRKSSNFEWKKGTFIKYNKDTKNCHIKINISGFSVSFTIKPHFLIPYKGNEHLENTKKEYCIFKDKQLVLISNGDYYNHKDTSIYSRNIEVWNISAFKEMNYSDENFQYTVYTTEKTFINKYKYCIPFEGNEDLLLKEFNISTYEQIMKKYTINFDLL